MELLHIKNIPVNKHITLYDERFSEGIVLDIYIQVDYELDDVDDFYSKILQVTNNIIDSCDAFKTTSLISKICHRLHDDFNATATKITVNDDQEEHYFDGVRHKIKKGDRFYHIFEDDDD